MNLEKPNAAMERRLWSAASSRRFVRWGDLSPKQCRVKRHAELPQFKWHAGIVRPTMLDGDKSPAQSDDKSSHSKVVRRQYLSAVKSL